MSFFSNPFRMHLAIALALFTVTAEFGVQAAEKRPFAKTQQIDASCLEKVRAQAQSLLDSAEKKPFLPVNEEHISDAERAAGKGKTEITPHTPIKSQHSVQASQATHASQAADASRTKSAPPPILIGRASFIQSDEVVVGPVSFRAPHTTYDPGFGSGKPAMAKTQQLPHRRVIHEDPSIPHFEPPPLLEADPAQAVGWYEKADKTLGYHRDVIEEKVAEAWAKTHGISPGRVVRPLRKRLGTGLYKWVYEDPYDPEWVIKIIKPGGAEGRTMKEIGDVSRRTAMEFRFERESELLMQKLIERHHQQMLNVGESRVTSIELLERQYPDEAARFASFRERKMPQGGVDIKVLLESNPELENHPDFKNIFKFLKDAGPLKMKHRVERGLSAADVFVGQFKTKAEAEQSVFCRLFGAKVPDEVSYRVVEKAADGTVIKKVAEWRVSLGIDTVGSKNLVAIPLSSGPNGRYKFVFLDY